MGVHYWHKKKIRQLSLLRLEQLKTLFAYKNWPIEENEEWSVFERFYNTLLLLDDKEQDFLIGLTYNFDHIPLGSYITLMLGPLKQLRKDAGDNTLFFVTCTPKEDVGSVKSSSTVLYQLKGTTIKQHLDLSPTCVVENILKVPQYNITDKTTIVLVDDFVGTGDTAIAAVEYIHELIPSLCDNSRIIVFSIVALHEGIERLKNNGIKCYYAIDRGKAITEEMKSEEREESVFIMQGIERRLKKLKEEYRFGYKGSEALVCLERCPNNTFPIYWLTKDIAPYER